MDARWIGLWRQRMPRGLLLLALATGTGTAPQWLAAAAAPPPIAQESGPVLIGPGLALPGAVPAERLPPVREITRLPRLSMAAEPSATAPAPLQPVEPPALIAAEPVRSERLERIAREADRLAWQAFELAEHNAVFAARAKLHAALRLVAQGLDGEYHTDRHGQALAAALAALREADDLALDAQPADAAFDLRQIIAGHSTPALKDVPLEGITPMEAMTRYMTFAQEHLREACGAEVAGSMALYGLGRLYAAVAQRQPAEMGGAEPKAIACYQAALLVFPGNHLAANELGVLLARFGELEQARRIIEHGLSIRPEATGWHNLAVLHERMGRRDLAARARRLAQLAGQEAGPVRPKGIRGNVEWLSPAEFDATLAESPAARGPLPARNSTGLSAASPPATAGRSASWGSLQKK